MDSNTHSTSAEPPAGRPADPPDQEPDGLAGLTAAVDELAAQDLGRLTDAVRAERVLGLRRLVDRLEGQWLKELAGVDARDAAGADQGQVAGSTAGWLRRRLRLSAGTAAGSVRTARALFRGPLPQTGQALVNGELSPVHAKVLADGTHALPAYVTAEAEPMLLEAAGRLDPPLLRRAVGHLCQVADPDGAGRQAERRHDRRGLWLSPTWEGMVAVDGLLEPEAGNTLVAALEPLARPADADDRRSGGQRTADALTELARRALEGGRLPQVGGVRPQLLVTVDLDTLLGRPGAVGGEAGWAGPLDPESCRRLACDGELTRVLVTRHPTGQPHPGHDHGPTHHPDGRKADQGFGAADGPGARDPSPPAGDPDPVEQDPSDPEGLRARLRTAMTLLPPILGGPCSQPLEVGRATRVVQPAQRSALAVRDGGCVFPGCSRPLAWCEAHHLRHWLHGGPTDLANLALLCRSHHHAVHEDGWRLVRGPDGRFTATPPHRTRRHPSAA
jgi:hypothetical protein